MEVQRESSPSLSSTPVVEFYRPSSFDSVTTAVSHNWTMWNCTSLVFQTSIRVLVWLLGLLYFSSLPLGIYLLVSKKVTWKIPWTEEPGGLQSMGSLRVGSKVPSLLPSGGGGSACLGWLLGVRVDDLCDACCLARPRVS